MKKLETETLTEYLDRIEKDFNYHASNIEETFKDMREKGITGFCLKCGCSIYKDKKHKCEA